MIGSEKKTRDISIWSPIFFYSRAQLMHTHIHLPLNSYEIIWAKETHRHTHSQIFRSFLSFKLPDWSLSLLSHLKDLSFSTELSLEHGFMSTGCPHQPTSCIPCSFYHHQVSLFNSSTINVSFWGRVLGKPSRNLVKDPSLYQGPLESQSNTVCLWPNITLIPVFITLVLPLHPSSLFRIDDERRRRRR